MNEGYKAVEPDEITQEESMRGKITEPWVWEERLWSQHLGPDGGEADKVLPHGFH